MQADPQEEWRRLTRLYGEMGDLEIRELADQINDLTDTAQQILRDEIKKRGISESSPQPRPVANSPFTHWTQEEDAAPDPDQSNREPGSSDFTWKTALCRCESMHEAAARCEMLRRSGVESWIQHPGSRFPIPWADELGAGDIQVNVAADQLQLAKAIVAQPIPQDILDQVKEEQSAPAYESPACPKCKAADPILESVEPSNNWLCESCGHTWSDPIHDPTESAQ
jgi:hypothetical protein